MVGLLYPSFPAAQRGTKINMNTIHTRHQNCRHWSPKRMPLSWIFSSPQTSLLQESGGARRAWVTQKLPRAQPPWWDLKSCTSDNSKEEMEPNYDPIEKENHLPNFYFVGSMLIFPGIYIYIFIIQSCKRWVSWKSRGPHFGCDKTWQENRRSFGSLGQ